MPKSKKDLSREQFLRLADLLGQLPNFMALIEDDEPESRIGQAELRDEMIAILAHEIGYQLPSAATVGQDFHSRLCQIHDDSLPMAARKLKTAMKTMHNINRRRAKARNRIAHAIGFKTPAVLDDIYLLKLRRPYPPPDHMIFEIPRKPFPPPPRLIDRTCMYTDKYHNLIEYRLKHTLDADKSAIFYDKETKVPFAIVVRGLAQEYFDLLQPWAVHLVKESLRRRYHTRRNNPEMAGVGVSRGARNGLGLCGWIQNLKEQFKKADDQASHERAVSSLFGIAYALIRSRLPSIVGDTFENTMKQSGIPRLDRKNCRQFTVPLETDNLSFTHYPLALPEGYMAHNFSIQIHRDSLWNGCPWAVYWNILRRRKNNQSIGKEAGGSFFIADYGLRIINASNTCVAWHLNLYHGTGIYEDGLEHVGIAMLLSKHTETSWKKFQKAVKNGLVPDGKLDLYEDMH
jgi:hypothetical protein